MGLEGKLTEDEKARILNEVEREGRGRYILRLYWNSSALIGQTLWSRTKYHRGENLAKATARVMPSLAGIGFEEYLFCCNEALTREIKNREYHSLQDYIPQVGICVQEGFFILLGLEDIKKTDLRILRRVYQEAEGSSAECSSSRCLQRLISRVYRGFEETIKQIDDEINKQSSHQLGQRFQQIQDEFDEENFQERISKTTDRLERSTLISVLMGIKGSESEQQVLDIESERMRSLVLESDSFKSIASRFMECVSSGGPNNVLALNDYLRALIYTRYQSQPSPVELNLRQTLHGLLDSPCFLAGFESEESLLKSLHEYIEGEAESLRDHTSCRTNDRRKDWRYNSHLSKVSQIVKFHEIRSIGELEEYAFMELGRYVIIRKLGSGKKGTTYKVYSPMLDQFRAIKLIPPEKAKQEEARTLAKIDREDLDHIVQIYTAGNDIASINGQKMFAIVMEYVDGKNLREVIEEGPHELDQILDWSFQVFSGLYTLKKYGITHCDLHPKNIMRSENGQIKIVDFGLATTDLHPRVVGARSYSHLSTEEADDFFSWGLIAYELSTKEHFVCKRPAGITDKEFDEMVKREMLQMYDETGRLKEEYKFRINGFLKVPLLLALDQNSFPHLNIADEISRFFNYFRAGLKAEGRQIYKKMFPDAESTLTTDSGTTPHIMGQYLNSLIKAKH